MEPQDLAEVIGMDVRFAAVVWTVEEDDIRLVMSDCTHYEALGMLQALCERLRTKLAKEVIIPLDDDEEDEELSDDEEEEDEDDEEDD